MNKCKDCEFENVEEEAMNNKNIKKFIMKCLMCNSNPSYKDKFKPKKRDEK